MRRHPSPLVTLAAIVMFLGAAATFEGCSDDGATLPATSLVAVATTLPEAMASSSTGGASSSTSTTTTSSTTTTTTIPLVTVGAAVKVANSSGVPGAARRMTDQLAALGFLLRDPTNGVIYDSFIEVTKIYATPEGQAVAESVARVLGGVEIQRMPTPAPIVGANESLGDATVLVMVGKDLAAKPLPGA